MRSWLDDAGLRVDAVPASRLWVASSGRASDVERALGTTLGMYRVGSSLRRASSSDPLVPSTLAGWWGEETLDLQAIHSMAPGASLVYLGARDNSGRGLLERFEFAVDGELAQIISNSYGTTGEKIAPNGVAAWEAVLQQAAALGIGSYFSSGDCGDNRDLAGLCGGAGYITTDYSASSP